MVRWWQPCWWFGGSGGAVVGGNGWQEVREHDGWGGEGFIISKTMKDFGVIIKLY